MSRSVARAATDRLLRNPLRFG